MTLSPSCALNHSNSLSPEQHALTFARRQVVGEAKKLLNPLHRSGQELQNEYRCEGDSVKHYKVSFVKKLPYFENGKRKSIFVL